MWRCVDVEMWMWRCVDVEMCRCVDVEMWRCVVWKCGDEDVEMC